MATKTLTFSDGSGSTGGTSSSIIRYFPAVDIPLFSTINSITPSFSHSASKTTGGSLSTSKSVYYYSNPELGPIATTNNYTYSSMSSGTALTNTKILGNGTLHAGNNISDFDFRATTKKTLLVTPTIKSHSLSSCKATINYTPPEYTIQLATQKTTSETPDIFAPKYNNRLFTGVTNGDGTATITLHLEKIGTDYDGYTFSRWEDGTTELTRTISLNQDATFIAYFSPPTYTVNFYDTTSGEDVLVHSQTYDMNTEYETPALPTYSGTIPEGYGLNPIGWATSKEGSIRDNYIYEDDLSTIIPQYSTFSNLTTAGSIINLYFGFYPLQYEINYISYLEDSFEKFSTFTEYRAFGKGDSVLQLLPSPSKGYKLTNQIEEENSSINPEIINSWFTNNENLTYLGEKISQVNSNFANNITVYSYEIPIQYTVNYYDFTSGEDVLYTSQLCNYNISYDMPSFPIIETIPTGYTTNPTGWVNTKNGNIRYNTTTMYQETSTTEILNQYIDFVNLSANDGDVFNYYFGFYPIQYSITYHNFIKKTLEGTSFIEYRIFNNGDYVLSNLPVEVSPGYKLTNQMSAAGAPADFSITNSWFTSLEDLNPGDPMITFIESTYADNIDIYSYETANTYIVNFYNFTSGTDELVEQKICEPDITYDMPNLPIYENSKIGYTTNPTGWVNTKNGNIKNNTNEMYAEKSTTDILNQYNSFTNLSLVDGDIFNYYFGLYPIQYTVNYKLYSENTNTNYTTKTEWRIFDNGDYSLSDLPHELSQGYKLTNKMHAYGESMDDSMNNYWFTSLENIDPDDEKITTVNSQYADDITVYSYETPIDYVATFHICDYTGEELNSESIKTKYSEDLQTPGEPEEKQGRIISGWYSGNQDISTWAMAINSDTTISGATASPSLQFNFITNNLTTEDNAEVHYYAYYIPKTYSINYEWLDDWSKNSTDYPLDTSSSRVFGRTEYIIPVIPTYDNYNIDFVGTNQWYYFENNDLNSDYLINGEDIISPFLIENRTFYAKKTPKPRYVTFHPNVDDWGTIYINKSTPNEDGYMEGTVLEVYAVPSSEKSFLYWGNGSQNPLKTIQIKDTDLAYELFFRDETYSVGITDLYYQNAPIKKVYKSNQEVFSNTDYQAPTYTITNLNSTYPFSYNSSTGYYVSTNKAVSSSYSLCQIDIKTTSAAKMYVDCISYGQSTADYGILSVLGQELGTNNNSATSTSSTVYHTFYGKSSSSVQTVVYNLPQNMTDFIQIKYRKDSSSSSYNDTLQFKIRFEELI